MNFIYLVVRKINYFILLLLLTGGAKNFALAAETTTPINCSFHANRLIEIPAKRLSSALGRPVTQLQAMSYRNGVLSPITSQFENKNLTENSDHLNILTANNRLLIRANDLGETLPASNTQTYLDKITLNTPEAHGVIYVTQTQNTPTQETPIHYFSHTGVLETECFKLKTSSKNFLIWNGFFYKTLSEPNRNLLDSFKLRLSAKLLGPLPRMDADNSDIIPKLIAVDEGPLRTRLFMKATVTVLKIPVTYIDMTWTIDNVSISNLVTVTIPPLLTKMVSQPYVSMSLDGRKMDGGSVITSANPKKPTKIDGKMDAQESALNGAALDPRKNWISLKLPMPLVISSQVVLPQNFNTPFTLLYQDDKNLADPPERFTGQEPNVGYKMTNFPLAGQFIFRFGLFFSDGVEPPPV